MGWLYRIDPKDVEETVKIHKALRLKLEKGLHEMLMQLGAVNVQDLQKEEGDEDAEKE